MAVLPKHVLFKEQGIAYALREVSFAYQNRMNPVTIQGQSNQLEFCKDVEILIRRNFPVETVTGTKTRLTVKFKT